MTITIKQVLIRDVLTEIADQLAATNIQSRHNETTVVIPYAHGQGFVRGINFRNGLGLIVFHCKFRQEVVFHYSLDRSHPLRLIFCQQGTMSYEFEPENISFQIKPLHASLSTSTRTYDQRYCFPADTEVEFTSLEIDRPRYLPKIEADLPSVPERLQKVLRDIRAEDPFSYQSNYSIALADVVYQIHHTAYEGLSRKCYLEARSLDLFAEVIHLFADDQQPNHRQVLLRKSDLDLIVSARNIMVSDLSRTITIPELAKEVGINTTKLKQGFKLVYHQTVNEYLRHQRLEEGKDHILEGQLSVKEIAERVGYRNPAYFSARFKERYGALPTEYLKHRAHYLEVDQT